MIKAVLFDFDDTLVDTVSSKIPAIIEYCASVHNVSIDSHEVKKLWGMPFWEKMRILSKSTEIDTSRYLAISEKYPLLPFPESEKILTELQSRVSIGIVTSLARPVLLHSLSTLGWSALSFTTLVTEGEAPANKPDPRVFEPALTSLEGIKREEILYVGDALTDARAASDAGLHFLGIARDKSRRSTFREAGLRHESSLTGVLKLC